MLNNLRKNVCFLHNPDKKLSPQFVMHCDWCSLLNGICHTIKTNAGPATKPRGASVSQLMISSGPRPTCASPWRVATTRMKTRFCGDADAYCEENFGTSAHESLRVFSRFALRLERVELVWCPFKRCAEDYYRNTDERQVIHRPENEEALYKRLGAMLGDTSRMSGLRVGVQRAFPMGARTRDRSTRRLDALCNDL